MESGLEHLLAEGIISEVLGRLQSGKEAEVFVVRFGDRVVAAKVYKDRAHRSFKNNSSYKEGRAVRSSRSQRAMDRGSKFGKTAAEDAWKSAEADALYKLHAAEVRVPTPVLFLDGVLLMELVLDAEGKVASRLIDTTLTAAQANLAYHDMLTQLVRILACDLIHGDLSPYNVLWAAAGPTVIDFPQIVSASHNSSSERFFLRDAENILQHFVRIDRSLTARRGDASEIWSAYQRRELSPDFLPTGKPFAARRSFVSPDALGDRPQASAISPHAPRPLRNRGSGGPEARQSPAADSRRPERAAAPSRGNDRSAFPQRPNDRGAPPQHDRAAPQHRGNDRGGPRPNDRGAPPQHDRAAPQHRGNDRGGPPPRTNDRGAPPQQDRAGPQHRGNDRGGPPHRGNDRGGPRGNGSSQRPASNAPRGFGGPRRPAQTPEILLARPRRTPSPEPARTPPTSVPVAPPTSARQPPSPSSVRGVAPARPQAESRGAPQQESARREAHPKAHDAATSTASSSRDSQGNGTWNRTKKR